MIEMLMQYGLFLAKTVTLVGAIGVAVAFVIAVSKRERGVDRLDVTHLNRKYDSMRQILKGAVLPKKSAKSAAKAEKASRKAEEKRRASGEAAPRKRVFVINFHGDIKATGVAALREEITAVLTLATPADEVLVRLENSGGFVHEHGLAASQLKRVREKEVPLCVAVDKVAASGGYMMACVADRIIAAPFAVIGSIGVLAQLPNFHRLLEKHGVEFEQVKAGEFKRTVTVFGKNTEGGRAKLKQELEDTHRLFKDFIHEHRPSVDLDQVANGEHWYGARALELNLVDELLTSDDYLLAASNAADLYEISYAAKKGIAEKVASVVQLSADKVFFSSWQRAQEARMPV